MHISDLVEGYIFIAIWTFRDYKLISIASLKVQYILVIWHLFTIIVSEFAFGKFIFS